MATDMLSEHPLLSEPSSVSFYNWMSNAVGNRGAGVQESPVTKSGHGSLPTGTVSSRHSAYLPGGALAKLQQVVKNIQRFKYCFIEIGTLVKHR